MKTLDTKKLKAITYGFLSFLLSIALIIGAWNWLPVNRVSATPVGPPVFLSASGTEFNLPERVEFNDILALPNVGMQIEVTTPRGEVIPHSVISDVTGMNFSLHINQLGLYNVRVSNGADFFYNFRVFSFLRHDPVLIVEQNGAGVPTIMTSRDRYNTMPYLPTTSWAGVTNFEYNDGTWPRARVVFFDDNNEERIFPNVADGGNPVEVQVRALGSNNHHNVIGGQRTDNTADNYNSSATQFANQGRTWIEFSARIGDPANPGKVLSQDFEVQVRPAFENDEQPRLTVVGVPATASTRTRVTLPRATATDLHDTRLSFDIRVTDPNGNPVTIPHRDSISADTGFVLADTDRGGPAHGFTDRIVRFDNDRNMHFYPHMDGDYTVTYVATNHLGVSSVMRTSRITVSDRSAPVFVELEDWRIPTQWGHRVRNHANGILPRREILFPVPVVEDNSDTAPTVELIIRNPEMADVIRFRDILSEDNYGAPNAFATNPNYAEGARQDIQYWVPAGLPGAFSAADAAQIASGEAIRGFVFNITLYVPTAPATNSVVGDFVVEYRARDNAGNISTQRFTINISNDHVDIVAPHVEIAQVPPFLTYNTVTSVTDDYSRLDTFIVPHPIVRDAIATRPRIEYLMRVGDLTYNGDPIYVRVNGGERLSLDRGYLRFDYDTISRGVAIVARNETSGVITELSAINSLASARNPRFNAGGTAPNFVTGATPTAIPYGDIGFRLNAWDSVGNIAETDTLTDRIVMFNQQAPSDFELDFAASILMRQQNPNGGAVELRSNSFAVVDRFDEPMFTISPNSGATELSELVGFEVAIYEQQIDDEESTVTDPVWHDPIRSRRSDITFRFAESLGVINIYEIMFIPTIGNTDAAGDLNDERNRIFVSVRAFHANGDNIVVSMELPVGSIRASHDGSTIDLTSRVNVNMASDMEVLNWYAMRNVRENDPAFAGTTVQRYVLRSIVTNTGWFSVMGNRFRAGTTGEFRVSYFWDDMSPAADRQSITVSDSETPVVVVSGEMPSFLPRSSTMHNDVRHSGNVVWSWNADGSVRTNLSQEERDMPFMNDPNDPFNPASPFAFYVDGARNELANANRFYPYFRLPAVSASARTGNPGVTVEVRAPNGNPVNLYSDVLTARYNPLIASERANFMRISDTEFNTVHESEDPITSDIFFRPTQSGTYTVIFRPVVNNVTASPVEFTITVGNVVPPNFRIVDALDREVRHETSLRLGSRFEFFRIDARGNYDYRGIAVDVETLTFIKHVYLDGVRQHEFTVDGEGTTFADRTYQVQTGRDGPPTFDTVGRYEIIYTVRDRDGNTMSETFVINVSGSSPRNNFNFAVISTLLTALGVIVFILGAIYFFKFRKIKES